MVEKAFEITVKFEQRSTGWYPIVRTLFIRPDGYQFRLPLLLDTGADTIVLHKRFQALFPNTVPQKYKGFGDKEYDGAKTEGKVELFGRTLECEIGFADFEHLSWRAGFLGRECLSPFGIGFWESAHEFYVTLTP
jgi:hypothetical protein